MNRSRAVLTIAVGNPVYLRYASNLARSFRYWHPDNDIEFHLVTDNSAGLGPDLGFVRIHRVAAENIGKHFTSKLHMDQYLECEETLFIDADCLCVGHLGFVFDLFHSHDFSLIGEKVSQGELFGDIAFRCKMTGVPWTVRFCGSLYFLRKGKRCSEILAYARYLETQYDQLGLKKLRGVNNEEPLLGLAMAKHGEEPIADDGAIKADLMFYTGRPQIDILRGRASISNQPGVTSPYTDWNVPVAVTPVLMHFNSSWTQTPPYTSEATRMQLVAVRHWSRWLATFYVKLFMEYPHAIKSGIKNAFRKPYHFLFGHRKVKASDRL